MYEALAGASVAWNYDAMGDAASAAAWAIKSMARTYRLRDLGSTTIGLPIAALVAIRADRPEDAAVIVGAFEALCERYGVKPPLGLADPADRTRWGE